MKALGLISITDDERVMEDKMRRMSKEFFIFWIINL
jgi:hypothetical protein